MLIDTHAHLGDARFDQDRDEILSRAAAAGVGLIVEIADSPDEWDRSIALARARPKRIRCALGLHPYYADKWDLRLAEELKKKAKLPEIVACGEIGLDYAKCEIPRDVQRRSFLSMLDAAAAAELPVVIHCREAYGDLMPLLKDYYAGKRTVGGPKGVLHCFSGSEKEALQAVEMGFFLGVDGPATYPKNDSLRGALKSAGLENLVLETDSPWLPPQSIRGKRNEPASIAEIARGLAVLFSKETEEVAALTTASARDLYRLS